MILTAIVFSRGCQLACKIFLLKSSVSVCIASRSPPGRGPFLSPFLPAGTPIFLALKADLSACNTTSFDESVSNIRKKLWYDPVSTCLWRKLVGICIKAIKWKDEMVKSRAEDEDKYENKHALIISTPYTLKLIEDAVVLVQITKLAAEVVVDGNGLHRARLHVDVPDLEGEIVA